LDTSIKLDSGAEVRAMLRSTAEVEPRLRAAGIRGSSRVAIYDSGASSLAARLWWVLDYLGHRNIAILDGGFEAWKTEGGAVTTEVPTIQPGDFKALPDPTKIADYDYVKARLGTESTAVCDALSAKSYAEGAIEKTISLPSSEQFSDARKLKPAAELQAALLQLDVTTDKEVIFYCGAGYASAVDYYVARVLGYRNVRLYDGSLADWTARGEKLVPGGGL
jgi:thiosulfate/3-mercaptopyruvate sulfurtransferase